MSAVGVGGVLVSVTACDSGSSGSPGSAPRSTSPPPDHAAGSSSASATARTDQSLRASAIAAERSLLLACAAPAGVEPFATLRAVHLDHLRVLTSSSVSTPAPAASAPGKQAVAELERAAAAERRADCVRASPDLAPLLASLAASGNVALAVLAS